MSEGGPATPPGQKRVVVLREGPPKGRGKTLDGVLGVVGAVLLLLAVVLVNVLPETEVPDPQFRVEYVAVPAELPTSIRSEDVLSAPGGVLAPGESNAVDVVYALEQNNVYEVVVFLSPIEDFPESLPDTFRVELLDPEGTSIAISSEQPTFATRPREGAVTAPYWETVPGQSEHKIAFNLGGKPEDQIVTFEDGRNATLEEAEAAIFAQDTRPTQGDWTVRVWVETVGPCPEAGVTTSQSDLQRAQQCARADREQHGGAGDAGNPFILSRLEYTYYDIVVSEA